MLIATLTEGKFKMALSAFDDKSREPHDDDLAGVLGSTFIIWSDLKKRILSKFDPATTEWKYSGKSSGWGMRIISAKRVIIYMTPCEGYFLASFALGEKAVNAIRTCGLPASVMQVIDAAPKYAEGRGVRFEVKTAAVVKHIETIAACKMST